MAPAHERHAYGVVVDTNEHRLLDESTGELGVVARASVCSTISMRARHTTRSDWILRAPRGNRGSSRTRERRRHTSAAYQTAP